MKKNDIAYAITSFYYGYDVEKVKILESFNAGGIENDTKYIRVKHLESVGSSGIPIEFIFTHKEDAEEKLKEIKDVQSKKFEDSIDTKEKLVDFLYSHVEPNEKREFVKERIKEFLEVEIR